MKRGGVLIQNRANVVMVLVRYTERDGKIAVVQFLK